MNISNFLGWDIGGAHLKIANVSNNGVILSVEQYPTPLWKGLSILKNTFRSAIKKMPNEGQSHALTMTAELSDIFRNRQEGVNSIIKLCHEIFGRNIAFYTMKHGLKKINKKEIDFNQIASANWHASSTYVASLIDSGLFIDVGSTTTDIIPFYEKRIRARGINDQSRLRYDELIYTGVIRTPIMTLSSKVIFNGELQNIVNENFATTADIYRILGYLNEFDDLMETADGEDKSIPSSIRRLARVLGTDSNISHNEKHWHDLAKYFHEAQLEVLTNAIEKALLTLPKKKHVLVSAGVGHFLVKIIAKRLNIPCLNFSELFDCNLSSRHNSNICAPAVAIAHLNRLSQIK